MKGIFKKWTERVTDGTGDLFWIGKRLLISKNKCGFALSLFNEQTDDFDLYQQFTDRKGWEKAYRLARVVNQYGANDLCGVPQR